MTDHTARGSDDDYCHVWPREGHANVSHSVDAPPVRWIEICQFCGHISNRALREQLAVRASGTVEVEYQRTEELRVDRLGPTEDDVVEPEIVRPGWAPVKGLDLI